MLSTIISNSFLGIFSIFCIIFLIQYIAYKRKEYLFYGIYLFILVAYYLLFTTNIVFKDEAINIGIANLLKELISTLAIIFYTFFSIELLDLKKYSKKLYRYNLTFLLLNVFGLILYPVLYYAGLPGHNIYYYLTLLFSPISFYLLYLSIKLKVPYTKYVLIGSIITTIGGIISIIMSIKYSPNSYWPGQFAMVIDVMLFFYATQKKVVDLQAENLQLRYKQITELQSERQRISLELHDEVGGGLSTIFLMSELSKASGNDSKSLESISKNSKELVQKMNEIVWALNIKNDNLNGLIGYIRQYVVTALDDLNIDVKAETPQRIPEINIDGKNRRELFLIVKELINNIIKHSKSTKVNMRIHLTEYELFISINDNGIGFEKSAIKMNSFGLQGIEYRVKQLGGNIEWENNSGVTTTLKLPFKSFSYKSVISTH